MTVSCRSTRRSTGAIRAARPSTCRAGRRREHGDLLAVGRQRRHRLRHSRPPPSTASSTALEHGGVVKRGYLGVAIQPVEPGYRRQHGTQGRRRGYRRPGHAGNPGRRGGPEAWRCDHRKSNGQPIKDAADLTLRIGSFKPGDKVALTFLRDGVQQTAEATLAGQKSASVARSDKKDSEPRPALGLELAPGREGAETAKGVAIVGVDPNGEAAEKGLAPGDFILDVGGKPVSTPNEVKSDIATARQAGAKAVLMRVQTADGDRFVAFPLPKA